jgi:photosystem II stability/assembly factor-like uncharacterized protein
MRSGFHPGLGKASFIALLISMLGSCTMTGTSEQTKHWVRIALPTREAIIALEVLGSRVIAVDRLGRLIQSEHPEDASSWRTLIRGFPSGGTASAAFISDSGHIWAADGYFADEEERPFAVYTCTIEVEKWTRVHESMEHSLRVNKIQFWSDKEGIIFAWHALHWGGCLQTTDGGTSWTELRTWPVSDGAFLGRSLGIGLGKEEVLRTIDAGSSWTSCLRLSDQTVKFRRFHGASLVTTTFGCVFGEEEGYGKLSRPAVLLTFDGGKAWSRLPSPEPSNPRAHSWVTIAHPKSPNEIVLVVTEVEYHKPAKDNYGRPIARPASPIFRILRTRDGGITWKEEWKGDDEILSMAKTNHGSLTAVGRGGLFLLESKK